MKTRQDVMTWAEREPSLGADKLSSMKIAVAGLVFDKRGMILLHCRGHAAMDANGCLEGFGGSLDERDRDDLEIALARELTEEVRTCHIAIDRFLVCSHLKFLNTNRELWDWAVVTFLCRLVEGEPTFVEIPQMIGIGWFDLMDVASWHADERRRVRLIDLHGNDIEQEVGLSIWVPTVIKEYLRQRDAAPTQPAQPAA